MGLPRTGPSARFSPKDFSPRPWIHQRAVVHAAMELLLEEAARERWSFKVGMVGIFNGELGSVIYWKHRS